ncbi:hypothetical protein JL722_13631 [Aureococcus anophagefferens]|nr:hypothetical protein JL722_13631 [Aureococcus anophagefferens]
MSFVDLGGDGAHEVEVPLEPVLDATHYKTTTLADLDDFDPALLFASLPQPYRTISKVLEGIWEESWAKIEERHPEVVVDREPERPFRVVVSAGDPVPRPAEGDDGAAAPPEPEPQGGGKVAIVEVWPSDAPPGPRLSLLTTFETPSRPLALTLARDGRWLALTLSDGSTALHRLPSMAAMPDGDVDRKMERISEEQAVEWRAEYDKDLADVGRPTFALPAPERPTRVARLPADPGAKAPSRPATPAPAEGDELDEEPPVEVPTFHFVGCYSAAEGCATDASVVEVRASNVVRKHGLGALPPPPAEGEARRGRPSSPLPGRQRGGRRRERPLTILRLFSNPDGGPGDFAAEPPPSPPPGTAKSTAKPHGAESRTSLQSADTHKRSHRGGNVFAELTATNVTALDGDFAPQLPGAPSSTRTTSSKTLSQTA